MTGSLAGTSWQLPWYGRMAWENLLRSPFEQDLTIAFCMDDADRNTQSETPCEVYMYVGEKTDSGDDLARAGLTNGTLLGMRVWVDGVQRTDERTTSASARRAMSGAQSSPGTTSGTSRG